MADISTVIILHQDAEFSLIKFQKSLVNYLNAFLHKNGFHNNLFYSPYPLWLPLPDESFHAENKSQLKEIEKKIINLTLNDFISINKGSVFLDFIVKTQEGEFHSHLTIAKLLYNQENLDNSDNFDNPYNQKNQNNLDNPKNPKKVGFSEENFDLINKKVSDFLSNNFNNQKNDAEIIFTCSALQKLPFFHIKIFRIAICNKLSDNSQDISDFVWAKKNS